MLNEKTCCPGSFVLQNFFPVEVTYPVQCTVTLLPLEGDGPFPSFVLLTTTPILQVQKIKLIYFISVLFMLNFTNVYLIPKDAVNL